MIQLFPYNNTILFSKEECECVKILLLLLKWVQILSQNCRIAGLQNYVVLDLRLKFHECKSNCQNKYHNKVTNTESLFTSRVCIDFIKKMQVFYARLNFTIGQDKWLTFMAY